MLERRVCKATPAEAARMSPSNAHVHRREAIAPAVAVVVMSMCGALVGVGYAAQRGLDVGGVYMIVACTLAGAFVAALIGRRDARKRVPLRFAQAAPKVEEIRVRCDDMITCCRDGEPNAHFLQVEPRALLAVFDVLDDAALFIEGAAAAQRFPSREFVVVRELDSGAVISIDRVTEALAARQVLDPDEIRVDGVWHLDVLDGTIDDLQAAIDRRVSRNLGAFGDL